MSVHHMPRRQPHLTLASSREPRTDRSSHQQMVDTEAAVRMLRNQHAFAPRTIERHTRPRRMNWPFAALLLTLAATAVGIAYLAPDVGRWIGDVLLQAGALLGRGSLALYR